MIQLQLMLLSCVFFLSFSNNPIQLMTFLSTLPFLLPTIDQLFLLLIIRTKVSQTIKGIYQIAQNMSKVHLCERCNRLPPDVKKRMVLLRK